MVWYGMNITFCIPHLTMLWQFKLKRMKRAEHVAFVGVARNAYISV